MRRPRPIMKAAVGLVGTALIASPVLAGPAVATRWAETKLPQADCLERAEWAIKRSGFGRIERTEQSRYGTHDGYTAAIRCIVDNSVVFFIVSGPERGESDGLAGLLYKNFQVDPA